MNNAKKVENFQNHTYDSLLDSIGNTPLVRIPFDTPARVYAKLEYLNPGGSIKDRAAKFMIEKAERDGLLKPGGTIIEASSGNQGIATAMIGNIKGYRVIITVSEKVSEEKRRTLEAYGVEVITCKPTTYLTDPEGYHSRAMALHKKMPGSFMLNQYYNPDNARAHYEGIGREIWEQLGDRITHIVSATGSGGTATGVGRYMREKKPSIKIIGVDSPCSYYMTNKNPKPYVLEGMGIDYETPLLDMKAIDEVVGVSDENAIAMLKKMARTYGFLIGPASGAAAHAAAECAKKLTENDTVVVLFTDSGRAYLSKSFYA